jgi:hypothetical protein
MTIGKKIGIGLALTLAVILAVGCLAAYGTAELGESERYAVETSQWVGHTHDVLGKQGRRRPQRGGLGPASAQYPLALRPGALRLLPPPGAGECRQLSRPAEPRKPC